MKNIITSLLICCLVFSCQKDFLETVPDDRVSTAIFWQTETDALLAANGLYPTLDGISTLRNDALTDILLTNRPFDPSAVIQVGNGDSSSDLFFDEWENAYVAIRRAVEFFENVDNVETDNTALIDQLKGEVRTIRAYHYMDLVMRFGAVPLLTEGLTPETAPEARRNPTSEVWDYIETELTTAASEMPSTITTDGRITRGTALALKARAMLYAGRYAKAEDAARQVMDLGVYALNDDYGTLFQYEGENSSEIILARQLDGAIEDQSVNYYRLFAPASTAPSSNGSNWVPTKKMVDLYDMQNTGLPITDPASGFDPTDPYSGRDPRLRASLYVSGDVLPNGSTFNSIPGTENVTDLPGGVGDVQTGVTGFNIRKYVSEADFANQPNSGINTILLRYAEVLLIYAEAKIEQNDIDQSVLDAINEVRSRAGMPDIAAGLSQGEMRDIVRKERTVELAFEGLRLYDIRRWQIAEDVMPGPVYGITYFDSDGNEITVDPRVSFTFSSRDYLWPIPFRQRNFNPDLEQNPGW